jgi:hypothetical protein
MDRTILHNDRLRWKIIRILEREITEIRLYLRRPEPNIEDALARLDILEQLAMELKSGRTDEG